MLLSTNLNATEVQSLNINNNEDSIKLLQSLGVSITLFLVALFTIFKLFRGELSYIKRNEDPFTYRKELFHHHIIFSIIVSITVAPIFYTIHMDTLAIILNLFTITAIALLIISKKTDHFSLTSRGFMIGILILFSSGLYYANQEINVLVFLLIFPIFAFSIRGIKEGLIWVLIFLSILLLGYLYKMDEYNPMSYLFFIISYTMIAYLLFHYRSFEIKIFEQYSEIQEKKDHLLLQQTKYANMGEMLGAIIHQWRQPLSEISSNAMLIEVESKYKERLDKEVVKKSIEDINTLMLFMSKTLDSFQLVYKRDTSNEHFLLPLAINDTISVFKSVIRDIDITLDYDTHKEGSFYMHGIKEDIFNIFLILLKNSQDAFTESNNKNKKITISLTNEENSITINYQDNAGGISLEPTEKVFEQNSSSKKSGMGIGLYIVKKLITHRYNGQIGVQNVDGGVLFEFCLAKEPQYRESSQHQEHF
jgi:signal transduction histidine kinase